jgi:hypothetical protein
MDSSRKKSLLYSRYQEKKKDPNEFTADHELFDQEQLRKVPWATGAVNRDLDVQRSKSKSTSKSSKGKQKEQPEDDIDVEKEYEYVFDESIKIDFREAETTGGTRMTEKDRAILAQVEEIEKRGTTALSVCFDFLTKVNLVSQIH